MEGRKERGNTHPKRRLSTTIYLAVSLFQPTYRKTMKTQHRFCFSVLLLFAAAVVVIAAPSSSSTYYVTTRRRLASSSRSEAIPMGGGGASSSSSSSLSSSLTRGSACAFYLWNAPSALLHKWCIHLMKNNIYEGRGGVKFVRIEPGSVLQLLYPCSRYSPDSCLFCGGNFLDHMTLAWAKHLYTPFDRHLDWVHEQGVVIPPPAESESSSLKNNKKRKRSAATQRRNQRGKPPVMDYSTTTAVPSRPQPPRHVFHRQYVKDTEQLVAEHKNNNNNRTRRRRQRQRHEGKQQQSPQTQAPKKSFYRRIGNITYKVPFRNNLEEVTILRALVMSSVENLMRWEIKDNKNAARRMEQKNRDPCF